MGNFNFMCTIINVTDHHSYGIDFFPVYRIVFEIISAFHYFFSIAICMVSGDDKTV